MILVLHLNGNYIASAKYNGSILTNNVSQDISILLNGSNMDEIYDNLIKDLLNIKLRANNSISDQVKENEEIDRLMIEIKKMEAKRDKEVQFNKKIKYNVEINRLKKELDLYK